MEIVYSNDYLAHHGILGQKWGVRRYQNEDGSLTEAGKRRYGYDLDYTNHNRLNIARIRLGEARRVHDNNKRSDSGASKDERRESRHRVKLAKKEVKRQKRIEKGRQLAENGQSITGNKMRTYIANGAASLTAGLLAKRLNETAIHLKQQGKLTGKHALVLNAMANVPIGIAGAYNVKKWNDNKKLRAYNASYWSSDQNIANVGSKEFKDRGKELGLKTGARVPERKRRR